MSKLDLTNKVSPCCKKRIKEHELSSYHFGKTVYYTCSHCDGEITRTEILRANIDSDEEIKFPYKASEVYYRTHCSKCNEFEGRLEKLEAKFKVNEFEERQKIRQYINDELDKFDNKKIQFNDRYRIENEIMQMIHDLVRKLDEE